MGRAPCCDKSKVKRGPWSPEEDTTLKNYIQKHGTGGNWIALPHKAGLQRCGKSCRLRWLNYLRPDIKHGGFTQEEDYIICSLYSNIGSRWSVIASHLPGRTDNDVKNYWNTKLKKKLLAGATGHTNRLAPISNTNLKFNQISATPAFATNSTVLKHYQEGSDSQVLFLDHQVHQGTPFLCSPEVSNCRNANSNYSLSPPQEVSGLSASSCLAAGSWSGIGEDEFLMGLSSESPCQIFNGSGEAVGEVDRLSLGNAPFCYFGG